MINRTVSNPSRSFAPIGQVLASVALGMALFLGLLALAPVGYGAANNGKIFPGISVAGVDLSGLTPEEATTLLSQRLDFPERGRIAFQEGTNVWVAKPRDVGLFLDPHTSALAAYNVGRQGGIIERVNTQYQAWQQGIDLPPLMVFDERMAQKYIKAIALQVNRPIVEATLGVNGIDVVVNSGQVGRTLDEAGGLMALKAWLPTLADGLIQFVVHETPPVILDASAQAEIARKILSAPLTLTVPDAAKDDPGPWTFDQQTLSGMLSIERVTASNGATYQVGLNSDSLRAFLTGIAPGFKRSPQNARFIFNDETRKIDLLQSATIGRALDIETTLQAIEQKVAAGEHTVALDMEYTNPAVTDNATAEELGIKELVTSYTSYFRGSSAERIQNITTASSRFHGVMVPPGATFSMADVLGDVSLDTGYAEALIIFGDRTIKGVGGGVCQVSTTLFRTAFFGGYPVVTRYAHAYRVGYYEQTANGHDPRLAGLDATVFAPVVDFQFVNDSTSWLLMETYVNAGAATLTWKFYSTSDGRTVNWDTTGTENVVEAPDPVYQEDAALGKGEIKQVDWPAEGADVTISRSVLRDGQVLFTDQFATHYLPWRAVCSYGPGTEGMPPAHPDPNDPCSPN